MQTGFIQNTTITQKESTSFIHKKHKHHYFDFCQKPLRTFRKENDIFRCYITYTSPMIKVSKVYTKKIKKLHLHQLSEQGLSGSIKIHDIKIKAFVSKITKNLTSLCTTDHDR